MRGRSTCSSRQEVQSIIFLKNILTKKINPITGRYSDKLAWRLKMVASLTRTAAFYKGMVAHFVAPGKCLIFKTFVITHTQPLPTDVEHDILWREIQPSGNQPMTSLRTNNQYQARQIWLVQRKASNLNHVTWLESKARPSLSPNLVFVSLPFRHRLTVFLGHSWENFSKSRWLVPQEKMPKVRRVLRDSKRTENLRAIAFPAK